RVNFVDRRLTAPKDWRDVYTYDAKGKLLGWTRYGGAKPQEFTPEGLLVLEKDAKGRPVKARTVRYAQGKPAPKSWVNDTPRRMHLGEEVVTFAQDGDTPRVKSREKVKDGE